ncbi:hypothetical protein IKU74_03045 [bacterium]|nr:hypothetical protein [bacterium]
MKTYTNNLFGCSYIQELNELEAEGYSQEEALALMEDLESPQALKRSEELLEISKKIQILKAQGKTHEQAIAEIEPLLSK